MTDEERQALNDEWTDCQRVMWADGASSTDYWKAHERAKQIDELLWRTDQPGEKP